MKSNLLINKIRKIFQYQQLGNVVQLVKTKGGRVNPVYVVNNKYVVKFDALKRGFNKESFILKTFKKLPLPKLLAYDASLRIIPKEYIIQTKLEGENLSFVWPSLKELEKENIFKDLIKILKRFHARPYSFYGDIFSKTQHYKKWSNFFTDHYKNAVGLAKQTGLINKTLLRSIDSFYKKNLIFLDQPAIKPCFCHNDLHFANILVQGDKISGILDFDLALAAPFDFEFNILSCFFQQPSFFVADELKTKYAKPLKSCFKWLKKYYKELDEIPHIGERMSLYSVVGDLEMLWLCGKFKYGQGVKEIIINRLKQTVQKNIYSPRVIK